MKIENRLHDYKEKIANYEIGIKREQEAKKEALSYYNNWIKYYKRKLKALRAKYAEIKRSKNAK